MDNLELWYRANAKQITLSGQPPITFKANGEPLTDWTICGAQGGVGEKTENLLNGFRQGSSWNLTWTDRVTLTKMITADNQRVAAKMLEPDLVYVIWGVNAAGLEEWETNGTVTPSNVTYDSGWKTTPFDVNAANVVAYCLTVRRSNWSSLQPSDIENKVVMIYGSVSDLPADFVPYGYKIPVTCGGETTNIYIGDDPLEEGESVSYAENSTQIPTSQGTNTLTVNTTVQPSSVSVTSPGAVPEGLRKYLQCKYDVQRGAAN